MEPLSNKRKVLESKAAQFFRACISACYNAGAFNYDEALF